MVEAHGTEVADEPDKPMFAKDRPLPPNGIIVDVGQTGLTSGCHRKSFHVSSAGRQ